MSSFGISGTNAHVIVEQAPTVEVEVSDGRVEPGVVPLVVSGRTPEALNGQLEQLRSFMAQSPELSPVDVGFSLASGRSVFGHRAVLLASAEGVAEVARGAVGEGVLAVLFSGQGSQRLGMGRGAV
ncbi:hypothetical protein GCM10020000_05310 [Streptomyces olivoverticillatus]